MEVFDTVRHRLAEDLGVDPDRKLVEAHQYVIRPDVGTTTDTVSAVCVADGAADKPVGVENTVTSCDLQIFMYQAAHRAGEHLHLVGRSGADLNST